MYFGMWAVSCPETNGGKRVTKWPGNAITKPNMRVGRN